jgi:hypothetical protein
MWTVRGYILTEVLPTLNRVLPEVIRAIRDEAPEKNPGPQRLFMIVR